MFVRCMKSERLPVTCILYCVNYANYRFATESNQVHSVYRKKKILLFRINVVRFYFCSSLISMLKHEKL